MEQHLIISQFSDISNKDEINLQKGSKELLNIIKNENTLDKKISRIQLLNLKNDEKEYQNILYGILYGILFDENMNFESYFSILIAINYDSYITFLKILADFLEFSNLNKEKYDKIYQIFERFIKIKIDSKYLIDILIIICRNIYPGQELICSIIGDNAINNNSNDNHNQNTNPNQEENFTNNYYYKFLIFIKSNLNFILENDMIKNLTGLVFSKILRILSETHIYRHIYSNDNSLDLNNSNNNSTLIEIANTYQKVKFSEQTKKLINEIYDIQIYILTKLYQEKKQKVFEMGRELIRLLIPIGKSNIEIINLILADLANNNYYEEILSIQYPQNNYNRYTQFNIPPLMERMIVYILTNVKRSSLTFKYYFKWMCKKFKIENCIGNTILVDLIRFIVTNYFYNQQIIHIRDFIPRWYAIGFIFKEITNHIISSEIKQALFMDLILFDKERDKDNYNLIEPSILSIINNMKDAEFYVISEELIEFLESYAKHFDNNNINSQKRLQSIYDAFQMFQTQNYSNNNEMEKSIRESTMDERYKNCLINLIKNENSIKINNKNTNKNVNNNQKEINKSQNISNNKNKDNNNDDISPSFNNINNDINNTNNLIINPLNNTILNQLNEKEKIQKKSIKSSLENTNNKNIQQLQNKNKEINIELMIPKEINTYIQKNILNNFLKERNQKNLGSLLNDIYNYNIKTFGKSDSSLKILDSSYKSLCRNFAEFFIKVFKDELEFKDFDNLDYSQNKNDQNKLYVYTYLFDFCYEKYEDIQLFSFIADLINKIIEIYPFFILHLMSYVLNITINPNKKKKYNGINFFYQLNKRDNELVKDKLIKFFEQCEENFLISFIRDFFKYGGVEYFNKAFFDDEKLIYKIIRNCDLNCINTIKMSLINNNFILIDKRFSILYKNSFSFPPSAKNIFWNLIFAQGYIPSFDLENFLKFSINILQDPPKNPSNDEIININLDEFFDKVINSILILFKNEIYGDINEGNLENLCKKCIYLFEFNFDLCLRKYIYQMIDSFLKNYFLNNNDKKKIFYNIAEQYYKENCKNVNKLKFFDDLLNNFVQIQQDINKNKNGDKNNIDNNKGWISDEIKNLRKNIIREIKQLSYS